ncbi:MAG: glycoside hydrolase family 15 [Propionibacteriaceae bacterium]|nr:glycoside hydrolase family 15 [Propionibacteriaceae bacterium]
MTPSTADLLAHSRALILDLQDDGGAYPASPTFSAYRGYCWLRDGSFIADAMSAIGEIDSASRFFDWCAATIERYQDRITAIVAAAESGAPLPDEAMLPTRFTFSGGLGTASWEDFQLDGYGTWLWALAEHARRHGLDLDRWSSAISATTAYLASSWMRPCYDWWEEHDERVHVSTLGCVSVGLRAGISSGALDDDLANRAGAAIQAIEALVARRGIHQGHLVKWLDADTADGSLSALLSPLGFIDARSSVGLATIKAVETELCVDGGVYRFRADTFFGGGRWPLLSCFLGLAELAAGDRPTAQHLLDWALSTAAVNGDLPEQVDGGSLLSPEHRQAWIDRWGPVAQPLLWSHAMVLRLAQALADAAPTADEGGAGSGAGDNSNECVPAEHLATSDTPIGQTADDQASGANTSDEHQGGGDQ